MSDFKVLDSAWFTPGNDCIGIVIGETAMGERKAYIKNTDGYNIKTDVRMVATTGAPFPLDAAYEIFKHLKPEKPQ